MKIFVLADLHLDEITDGGFLARLGEAIFRVGQEADVMIVAGDLAEFAVHKWPSALRWLGTHYPSAKTVIIPGNHDYYDGNISTLDDQLERICTEAGCNFGQCRRIVLGSTQVLIATLWTDMNLFGANGKDAVAVSQLDARNMMPDYADYAITVGNPDWQFREVALCVRHDHPIVPLWKATAQLARFDIGARLREIAADILSGSFDRPKRAASGYDLWLDRRLEDGFDDTWLKDHPIFVSTVVCQALGELLSKEEASEHENTLGCIHAVGFDIAIKGEKAIRIALDQIAAASMGALDEPNKAFGRFYKQLNNYYLNDPDFDLFRDILRECILENWSIAAGEKVLGQFVPERRLHSLTTASKATGIGANLLEQFLEEAGALGAAGGRPQSRRLFDARKYAGLLAEIPTLVGPIAMRKAMGATKQELALLADEGLLIPRTRIENINNPWRISDGMALLAELSFGAMLVEKESKDWETLLLASRRSSVALADLVLGIREKRLTLGQRAGVAGFHGIVVRKSEVDLVAAPRLAFRDAVLQEVPGTISAAAFGRSIGLRNDGTFLALVEAGHVPVRQVMNPRTGRPQYQMTPEDMAAFHQRFMTLTTLSAESGLHRNTLRGALLMRKITPFSSGGQDFGSVYLRDDLMDLIKKFHQKSP